MAPRAWKLYRLFCFAMVGLNLAVTIFAFRLPIYGAKWLPDVSPDVWVNFSSFAVGLGLVLTIGNAVLPFLPRTPVTYGIHLTNLILSAAGILFAPICVPLLLQFNTPPVHRYFGVRTGR